MLPRLLYSIVWYLGLPLLGLRLLWRARRQPAYLQALAERFAVRYPPRPVAPLLWVHAVSVGETRAAQPLVSALLARYPEHVLLLTCMTPTGRDTARALFPDPRVVCAYLPYDLPDACQRFLRHYRPRLGVLMETELWPNLVHACHCAGVPVLLANARLSERSAHGYRRIRALFTPMLGELAAVAAQSQADAGRLQALGAPAAHITGNLKFDLTPPAAQLALGQEFRARIGLRPCLLLASTRDGEERPLLEAFLRQAPTEVLLLLVPRHPQRFEAVAALLREANLSFRRRSDGTAPTPDERVWLGDSMGEMYAYFATADVAIMGGSWLPLGGQNPIEACAVGCPVICGPHTYNFAAVTRDAADAGALEIQPDVEHAIARALAMLADTALRAAMQHAGLAFAARHRGATARTMEVIETLLPPNGP